MVMKKAFTLVEMLIVIAVFGTGILAVLYGIAQTLGNQDRAKTQITSSFLAREGIELMYNLRDSNYRKELARNCVFQTVPDAQATESAFCPDVFKSGTVLKIAMGSGEQYLEVSTGSLDGEFATNFANYQLFYATGNGVFTYSYDNGGEPLWYARYLLIKGLTDGGVALPEQEILKIESHILFKKGEMTGETVMESFI
jgi:prepilin-type N-terminal cleavage/methylation domain-containing protein